MSDNIYLGNPNLKKSVVVIQWTQEQVQWSFEVCNIHYILVSITW